jgi:hypothetical protein
MTDALSAVPRLRTDGASRAGRGVREDACDIARRQHADGYRRTLLQSQHACEDLIDDPSERDDAVAPVEQIRRSPHPDARLTRMSAGTGGALIVVPYRSALVTAMHSRVEARVGDWLEARGIHGEPARRGQIVEVLGQPGHERYRVRWDEQHESIVFPADGVTVVRHGPTRPRRAR